MATNTVKVELIGHDKSLGKSLKGAGKDASTFAKILSGVGKGLMLLGTVAIAAAVAAIAGLVAFIYKAKAAYEEWMKTVVDMTRMTGLGSAAASKLAGQFQLSGVEAKSGSTGVYMFGKALDKARQGTSTAVTGFQRLHISLKDGSGKWRSMNSVLGEARDKLSAIKDASTRAGIAALMFGKGAKTMLPWIIKSKDQMKEYTQWLTQAGLIMGGKALAAFKTYRENQKHMSVLWQGFKVNAYQALVPLINQLMPHFIRAMTKAAGWMKQFSHISLSKGFLTAAEQMIPGFTKIEAVARHVFAYLKAQWPKAMDWIRKNGPSIKSALMSIGSALVKVGTVTGRVSGFMSRHKTLMFMLKTAYAAANPVIAGTAAIMSHLGQIIGAVGTVTGRVSGFMSRHKTLMFMLKTAYAAANPVIAGTAAIMSHLGQIIGAVSGFARTAAGVIKSMASAISGVTTGALGAVLSYIQSIVSAAQTAYEWLQKLGSGKANLKTRGYTTGNRGPATGGITTGPLSGYGATLHGTELVVPMNGNTFTPNRVYDYGKGGSSGGVVFNVAINLNGTFTDGADAGEAAAAAFVRRRRQLARAY